MKMIDIDARGENKGHYSPGVVSGGVLYISGQLSLDPDTRKAPAGGIEAHMAQALANVERVLKSAGLDREDVVQCRVYITDIAHWDAVNDAFRAFFGAHRPARIVVPVNALHFGCLAEIEAVAECRAGAAAGRIKYWELDTPSLLIDREILTDNLQKMQDYANRQGVALRPHTKTHKMPEIARLQERMGACGIAVAKVGEAEVMAAHGLSDIFIANELVGRGKLARIAALAKRIRIAFGVDSVYQIEEAESVFAACGQTAEVLIEVEVGEVRCGVDSEEDCAALLTALEAAPHVRLRGVFGHDGNTYGAENGEKCREIAAGAQKKLVRFAQMIRARGLECPVVSYGSTPPLVREVDIEPGITELRPGTYALMDVSQGNALGTLDHCAATVLSSVVSTPTDARVVLDVGAKGITMQERTVGICASHGKGVIWGSPSVRIQRIFDEHAIIEDAAFRRQVTVGQKVRILPVHICPVCNLYDRAYLISGDEVVQELEISARGKLQ